MTQKQNFREAFENLKKKDASIVKDVITRRCGWGSFQLFYMKMRGERGLSDSEITIVETVFRSFGLDAWSGKVLVTA